jgi:hypothetical protein
MTPLEAYFDAVRGLLEGVAQAHAERYEEHIISEHRGNLRVRLRFVDQALLEISEALVFTAGEPQWLSYRYHYQDGSGNLLFRYDNAPHHPEVATHPDHKHAGDRVLASTHPSLDSVVEEVQVARRPAGSQEWQNRNIIGHPVYRVFGYPGRDTVICSVCNHPNEDHANFCDHCGQPLDVRCPACQSPTRAGARFCSQCGQSLSQPAFVSSSTVSSTPPGCTPSLDDRLDRLQSYLPQHLADKILANRGRLQGERKLVTVLFLDIVGYFVLSKHLGEEALFAFMDDLYEQFIHDVHRYEGTVNELTGDGIVAFLGAPLAVEQAPLRAVRAALTLQQTASHCSTSIEQAHGLRLQIRVGINTGPVIVGTVGQTWPRSPLHQLGLKPVEFFGSNPLF